MMYFWVCMLQLNGGSNNSVIPSMTKNSNEGKCLNIDPIFAQGMLVLLDAGAYPAPHRELLTTWNIDGARSQ